MWKFRRGFQPRQSGQTLAISSGNIPAPGVRPVKLLELHQSKSRRYVAESTLKAELGDIVGPGILMGVFSSSPSVFGDAHPSEAAKPGVVAIISDSYHATLTSRQILNRMKAEARDFRHRSNATSFVFRPCRMCRIL